MYGALRQNVLSALHMHGGHGALHMRHYHGEDASCMLNISAERGSKRRWKLLGKQPSVLRTKLTNSKLLELEVCLGRRPIQY